MDKHTREMSTFSYANLWSEDVNGTQIRMGYALGTKSSTFNSSACPLVDDLKDQLELGIVLYDNGDGVKDSCS